MTNSRYPLLWCLFRRPIGGASLGIWKANRQKTGRNAAALSTRCAPSQKKRTPSDGRWQLCHVNYRWHVTLAYNIIRILHRAILLVFFFTMFGSLLFHSGANLTVSSCLEPVKCRLERYRALLRPALYISEKDRPPRSRCWRVLRGVEPHEEAFESMGDLPFCLSECNPTYGIGIGCF